MKHQRLELEDQGVHKRQRIYGMENESPKGTRVFRDNFVVVTPGLVECQAQSGHGSVEKPIRDLRFRRLA